MTTAKQQLKELLGRRKRLSAPEIVRDDATTSSRVLSFGQQRLWFLHQYMGPNAAYNMPLALRLRGNVGEAALVRSLQELFRRHESLRTRFETREGVAVQVIDAPELELEVEQVSATEVHAIAYWERSYHFDLSRERLCRIRLLRETADDPGDYVLLVTMHHSISDGWSLGIFFQELVSLYRAYASGGSSPLAPLPIQYGDYAQWQRRWLQGEVLEQHLSYWRAQLKDLPVLLTLPTDRPRPAEQTFRGSTERFALPLALSRRVQALASERGVTVFMTLLSAFAVLLGRYSHQRDVAIGTPTANRSRRETEGLIGFFVNMLVMRHDLRGDPAFTDLLESTRAMALQAYAHQDVPFEQLVDAVHPERSVSHSPLFQVAFALQNAPFGALELSGLVVEPLAAAGAGDSAQEGTSRFDLTLSMQETPAGLLGSIEYNTDLFDRHTITRMLRHYARLLESAVDTPHARLSQLVMLGEDERHRQLVDWNARSHDGSRSKPVHERFEALVARTPDAIAVPDDERRLTCRELDERANALAYCLIEQGVKRGRAVGMRVEGDAARAIGMLGILKAGGICVPLPVDSVGRADFLFEDSEAGLIVTSTTVSDHVLSGYLCTKPRVAASAAAAACICYEADDDGVPAGRIASHASICGSAEQSVLSLLAWPPRTSDWIAAGAARPACYVLGRDGELLPAGAVGLLHVSGETCGWGYLHRPDLTAARFVPNPYSQTPGERMMRTGELARWNAAGEIELVDSEPGTARDHDTQRRAIAAILCGHASVREAAVTVTGTGAQVRFTAYLVARAPDALPVERLVASVKAHLRGQPGFHRLPEEWLVLDALPRTTAGAVDTSALPQPVASSERSAYVAPRTPLEETLVEVWREQLGTARVGVEDNYFALGGDSIRSISLVEKARQRGVHFSIKDLFAHPTISTLAGAIERGEVRGDAAPVADIAPFALLTNAERERLGGRDDIEDAYPLSTMQQGMVFEALRHAHLHVYLNIQIYEFTDPWHQEAFEQALTHLMVKHPMLRTIHDFSGERSLQLVSKESKPKLEVMDVSTLDRAQILESLDRWGRDAQAAGLDTTVSLWRAAVHVMPAGRFLLAMQLHHALWDGWSLESFITELYATYGMRQREGCLPQYRPLPSYKHFVALEQSALASEAHQSYWRRMLEGATVPWWTGRDKAGSALITCAVSLTQSRALRQLADRLGVQEKSVWCSVYLALLSLLNGTDEGVGTLMSQGRPEIPDGEKIMGVFLNALPVRALVCGSTWQDLIMRTDQALREQHAYRHYPLAAMQQLTGLDFSATMFNYTHWHVYEEGIDGTGTREEWIPKKIGGWQETNYLFNVFVHKEGEQAQLGIHADERVFDADFRERIGGYVARILDALVRDAAAPIDKTALLGDAERSRQMVEWNATARAHARRACIHESFEDQVRLLPDAIAVRREGSQLSYRELDRRANGVARWLRAHGAGVDARVAICMDRSPEMIVAILAVLKAGAGYVPLDPAYPPRRLQLLLADAGAVALLVDAAGGESLGVSPVPVLEVSSAESREAACGDENVPASPSGVTPRHCAYVIYTSGSTGEPKGVIVEHAQVVNLWQGLEAEVYAPMHGPVRSVSMNASFAFDASVQQLVQLLSGRTLTIIPEGVRVDPDELWMYLARQGVECFDCTPSLLESVISANVIERHGYAPKTVLVGGEAFNDRIWDACRAIAGVVFYNVYGPTECTVDATSAAVSVAERPIIGRPLPNTQVYVLDRNLQPVPTGVTGELCIAGAGVSRGYLGRPALTAERFVPNAFAAPGDRLYLTGDLARWSSGGTLECLGRIDTQVKVRGYRIELGEIESALCRHAAVRDAIVRALADGHGSSRLVGYVVPHAPVPDPAELTNALRLHLQELLPGYMVPSAWMVLAAFPRTTNGKLDLKSLPVPAGDALSSRPFEAPQGRIEIALARHWQELLRVERVGRHDNFFELGGHSLLALRVCHFVRQELGVELKVYRMLANPSVAQLAAQLAPELDAHHRGAVQDEEGIEEGII